MPFAALIPLVFEFFLEILSDWKFTVCKIRMLDNHVLQVSSACETKTPCVKEFKNSSQLMNQYKSS